MPFRAEDAGTGLTPTKLMLDAQPTGVLSRRYSRRSLSRVGWASAVCGALVTFIAVGFFIPLVVPSSQEWNVALLSAPLIVLYLVVSGASMQHHLGNRARRALAWVDEDREPTDAEHRMTLNLPFYAVKLDAAAWLLAGVVFSLLDGAVFSWTLGAVVLATIWLGGETTCAVGYLLYERATRPVTALALAVRPTDGCTAPGVRVRLGMAWLLGTGVPLVGLIALGLVGAFGWVDHPQYVGAAVLFMAIVASGTGFLATVLAARAIADPLNAVRHGLEKIARGDLDAVVTVDDSSEVGQLQAGFNQMAEGLRERQRIRDLFGRQVGEDVARTALREGARLGGEEREIAALFVDIVGSTSLALAMPATEVVRLLNRFFRVVIEVVEAERGLVNKFEGDAALCVFGAPADADDPAGAALRTARRLATRLSGELPEIDFGIGVSAGLAVAGNVGAEQRFEYTVIGDPVNEAARLSELARQRPERVLASEAALGRSADGEGEAWTLTDAAVLRGRSAPTQLAHPQMQTP
jgi:adenylate cyclase